MFCLTAQAQYKPLENLADEAAKAAKKRQLRQADSLYEAYIDTFRKGDYPKNYQFSEALGYMARRALQKGNVDQAIELQKEMVEVRKKAPDCNNSQCAAAVSDLASFYSHKGQYSQAIKTGEEALEILEKVFGTKHHFYNITLSNQASYYSQRGETGDYQKALDLALQAIGYIKKGTEGYANALNSLVVYYSQTGNRAEANKLSVKAREEARKRMELDGFNYAMVLNTNAVHLANANNYEDAIEYEKEAKACFEHSGRTQSLFFAKVLINLATFYSHQQLFNDAVETLETALPIVEKVAGRTHPDYLRCLGDLISIYKETGNMEKADELAHLSNQMSKDMTSVDNSKYARALMKQATAFASNGNYQRAIEQERKAIDIFQRHEDHESTAFAKGSLAYYLFADGQEQEGLRTAHEALDIFSRQGQKSPQWAQALNNMAILYYNHGDYDKASDYGNQALCMYNELGDTVNIFYARVLANNGLFAFMKDSVDLAIGIVRRAIDLHSRILGGDHPDNVSLLYNLSVYLSQVQRNEEAEQSFRQAIRIQAHHVRKTFLHLTSQEREKFWKQNYYVFRFAPMLAFLNSSSPIMPTVAYNALLFTKGILLNSDIDFKKLLKRSGDKSLLGKYNHLVQLREEEEDYWKIPPSERDATVMKRRREETYQLERALVKGCKEYGNFTEALAVDAKQVSASLKDDEAAVEFATIYVHGLGNTYLAFVLSKNRPEPQMIRLFSDYDLHELKYEDGKDFFQTLKTMEGVNQIYSDPRFGEQLWKPIIQNLQGVKKIYFSPSSMLYQLGIEYMPCDSTHRINDLFAVCRLSSTKLLVNPHHSEKIQKATVYGGLDYDMDLAQLRHQRDSLNGAYEDGLLMALNNNDKPVEVDMQRALDSLSLRGSVGFLEGTLHEAENIIEQLMQNGVMTKVYLRQDGTEESFKALSGLQQSVIHIATHGFYFSKKDIKEQGKQLVFLANQTDNMENPLNYSGLLLSGANYALNGNRLSDDLEDGILTAREIAQVDLGQVDLVVLSACQTGLGEIREDGVFGIQRGFKKAGVHSLMMSLWKVSDQATDLMMTTFYERLVAGCSRHQAFKEAQQAVREGGYEDPYYWASFILLDDFE